MLGRCLSASVITGLSQRFLLRILSGTGAAWCHLNRCGRRSGYCNKRRLATLCGSLTISPSATGSRLRRSISRPTRITPSDISKNAPSLQGLSHAGVARSRRRRMISAVKPDEPASNFQQRDNANARAMIALEAATRATSLLPPGRNLDEAFECNRRSLPGQANHIVERMFGRLPRPLVLRPAPEARKEN